MVAGFSDEQVAADLGIHLCTVAHWKADNRFAGYLTLLQHDANEMLLQKVVKASSKALDVLEQMIEDPKISWMQKSLIATRILAILK